MYTKQDESEEERKDETLEEKKSSEAIIGKFSGVKNNPHNTIFCMITENFFG